MRRPQTIDWQAHHATCLQALLESGDRHDLKLARIVQLLHVCEAISRTFSYDSQAKSRILAYFLG